MTARIRMDNRTWQVLELLEQTGGLKRTELARRLEVSLNTASAYLHILSRYGMAQASNVGRGAVWRATGSRSPMLRPISAKQQEAGRRPRPEPVKRAPPNSVFALGGLA